MGPGLVLLVYVAWMVFWVSRSIRDVTRESFGAAWYAWAVYSLSASLFCVVVWA